MKFKIIFIILILSTSLNSSILVDLQHSNADYFGSGESLLVEKSDINNLEIFPASLAGIKYHEASIGYISYLDMINIYRLAYAASLDNISVFGFAINYSGVNNINNYNESGALTGQISKYDVSLDAGYGIKFLSAFQGGINLKYMNVNIEDNSANWMGAGISILYSMNIPGFFITKDKNLNIGIGLENINIITGKFDVMRLEYPLTVHSGFIYKILQTKMVESRIGTTFTYISDINDILLSSGIDVSLINMLYLQTGYHFMGSEFNKLTLGFGIKKGHESVDFSFMYSTALLTDNHVHYLQIGISF